MRSFFRRLFQSRQTVPDVAVLQQKLQQSALQSDFWHGRYLDEKKASDKLRSDLDQETRRNREREDDLVNNILRQVNQPFPRSRDNAAGEAVQAEETKAAANDDELLENRAEDYCLQVYGDEYTDEQFKVVLAGMKNNSAYYLSN